MPPSDETASDGEQDELPNASVYDFLYHDKSRIGSFLAQFDDSGHLQQVRQSESAKKGHKRGFKIGANVGVPLAGSGGLNFERTPHDEGSEATDRVYDPLWSNALTLLDYLEAAHLLHRDITTANIGQFVIASGSLSLLNAAMLPKIWQSESVKRVAIEGAKRNAKLLFDANPAHAALKPADRAKLEKAVLHLAEEHGK